jgi:RNA polymerase sigma factor for flagellar operon FliA
MNTTTSAIASTAVREALILDHMPQVRALARRVHERVPRSITFDDLVAAGTLGLIQAADRFDADRHVQFSSYAQHRIRGAMLDFLREEDPLSRDERSRLKQDTFPSNPSTVSLDQLPPNLAIL